jgi:hypothetical protein
VPPLEEEMVEVGVNSLSSDAARVSLGTRGRRKAPSSLTRVSDGDGLMTYREGTSLWERNESKEWDQRKDMGISRDQATLTSQASARRKERSCRLRGS